MYEIFRFLDLPPEIRNEIYRLLLTLAGAYKCRPNPEFLKLEIESEPTSKAFAAANLTWGEDWDEDPEEICPKELERCQNTRKETLEYELAILRVNKKIHWEAASIFRHENTWIAFRFGLAGYAESFKDRGFGVIPYKSCSISWPILTVNVHTRTPRRPRQMNGTDAFLAPTLTLNSVIRALWTLSGSTEMRFELDINHTFAKHCPETAKNVLQAFYGLRGGGHRTTAGFVRGTDQDDNQLLIACLCSRHRSGKSILDVMKYKLSRAEDAAQNGRWETATRLAEEALAFLCDSYKMYCEYFVDGEPKIYYPHHLRVLIKLASLLSEANLILGEPEATVKYAGYGLRLNPLIVEERRQLLDFRAKALAALGRNEQSRLDSIEAQELSQLNATEAQGAGELPYIDDDRDRPSEMDEAALEASKQVLTPKKAE